MQETKKKILEVKDSDLGKFHLAVLYLVFFRFFSCSNVHSSGVWHCSTWGYAMISRLC